MGVLVLLFLLMAQKTYEHWKMPDLAIEGTNAEEGGQFSSEGHVHSHEKSSSPDSPCPVHSKKDKAKEHEGNVGENPVAQAAANEDKGTGMNAESKDA
uniref:Uncharacterized protein n=1 Tax=Trichuris muris TaxID=70415 RepID=A0A5S6R3N9_TRIMR